jgi:hypothetical protein
MESQSQPAGLSGGHHRTLPVMILAAVAVVAGLWNLLDTARYLGLIPVVDIYGYGLKLFNVNWLGAMLSGLVAVIWFAVAGQLWRLDQQGWMFVVLIAAFDLVFLFLSLFGGTSFQAIAPAVLLCAAALGLAMLPGTKDAFGRA